jgi:signal transduction histidine kinase
MTPALVSCVIVAGIGALICWSNPRRRVNRFVCSSSINLAGWLFLLHLALTSVNGLFWLRVTCAVGALVPVHFWLLKEAIADENRRRRDGDWVLVVLWVAVTGLLATLPFLEAFIPSHSSPTERLRGWAYYAFMPIDLALYLLLIADSIRSARRVSGVRRLELQVWIIGGCAMTAAVVGLMALNAVTHQRIYIQLQPVLVLLFYGGTVVAITTHRIFDARQILLVALRTLLLVALVGMTASLLLDALQPALPPTAAWAIVAAVVVWLAALGNRQLDRWFEFFPKATDARKAAFDVVRREQHADKLVPAFLAVLKGWGSTETALLLASGEPVAAGDGQAFGAANAVAAAMRTLRWATPERLARQRSTAERTAVAAYLEEQRLGALVMADGPAFSVLVGVGIAASRRPFTYPQITQLIELAAIMQTALERAHFSAKAQRAEQLATVGLLGASLAHEIRNPLVTIKTFVQLLPRHHEDPAFREKFFHLIGDEVTRIDQLTEQLLDLASPRTHQAKPVRLHAVLEPSLQLVTAKATDKQIDFRVDLRAGPDQVLSDEAAIKQVLLNLCFNAIQAVERHPGERWVKLSTRNLGRQVEMCVADSGPGIPDGIRPRLFQPFQSTKSSGFGLGLAICSDILADLGATISADPASPGQGATFRVLFPCPA